MRFEELSGEQQDFICHALAGRSVIVDACIGSGKTTAIQCLCDCLPVNKRILYLTYNKLLKLDAKGKITAPNADVTNYHGYAYRECRRNGHCSTMQDCLRDYVRLGLRGLHYDVLILDEYQDIDQEIADMLRCIRDANPGIQIIAVGDMAQKLYDRTWLRADQFIQRLVPDGYVRMEFTQCFRLSSGLAGFLGKIWGKEIVGVNPDCEVREVSFREAYRILSTCEPREILCLGANYGSRSRMLNKLEEDFPEKFNKATVWSKITDRDGGSTEPSPDNAIFTTFDGCKGMERDTCMVFDFTPEYWAARIHKPEARYEIIRNIFCVAASRGKRRILFVNADMTGLLDQETLMDSSGAGGSIRDMDMSSMFDFKYSEDVEAAYRELDLRQLSGAGTVIQAPTSDGLIDLSPCIGIYTEAGYFDNYNLDAAIMHWRDMNPESRFRSELRYQEFPVDVKVLFLVHLETNQDRYWAQVTRPYISDEHVAMIHERLAGRLPKDAKSQVVCAVPCAKQPGKDTAFALRGICDVFHEGRPWELKFVQELSHVHFLQAGMYAAAMGLPAANLWNVRTGELWEVRVPNRRRFLSLAVKAATKGRVNGWFPPADYDDPVKEEPADKAARRAARQTSAAAKTAAFIQANAEACLYVDEKLQCLECDGYLFTDAMIEDLFRSKGLRLPVTRSTFVKYFRRARGVLRGKHGEAGHKMA